MAWTAQQIIDQASKNTERRAESKYDLAMEFWLMLDDFCRTKHYWWRRKYASFQTVVNQQVYDLSQSNTTISSPGYPDLDEIEDIYTNIGAQAGTALAPGSCPLKPLLSAQELIAAKNTTTASTPAGYFIDPTVDSQSVILAAPADQVAKMFMIYWAVPMVTDTGREDIPLVPRGIQWGLVDELECRIYGLLLVQDDPRFQMAVMKRERFRSIAAQYKSWTSKKTQELRSADNAVRAHG